MISYSPMIAPERTLPYADLDCAVAGHRPAPVFDLLVAGTSARGTNGAVDGTVIARVRDAEQAAPPRGELC